MTDQRKPEPKPPGIGVQYGSVADCFELTDTTKSRLFTGEAPEEIIGVSLMASNGELSVAINRQDLPQRSKSADQVIDEVVSALQDQSPNFRNVLDKMTSTPMDIKLQKKKNLIIVTSNISNLVFADPFISAKTGKLDPNCRDVRLWSGRRVLGWYSDVTVRKKFYHNFHMEVQVADSSGGVKSLPIIIDPGNDNEGVPP